MKNGPGHSSKPYPDREDEDKGSIGPDVKEGTFDGSGCDLVVDSMLLFDLQSNHSSGTSPIQSHMVKPTVSAKSVLSPPVVKTSFPNFWTASSSLPSASPPTAASSSSVISLFALLQDGRTDLWSAMDCAEFEFEWRISLCFHKLS